MNILFIANHINVGGISSYLLTLASGLKQKGHQIYLASSGGELEYKFIQAGITHFKVPLATKNEVSYKIFFSFWQLRKVAREFNIDLIHSHSRTTQVLGDLLGRSLAKPHIFTCHGFFKPKLSRRIFGCWGQKVIAISQQVKEHLIIDFRLDENKIAVINNGIDTKNFGDFSARESMRQQLGMPTDTFGGIQTSPFRTGNEYAALSINSRQGQGIDFLVGIIARLSSVKGHTYLIQAMPEVIRNFPNAKLLIIGQGKTKDVLIRETQDLGLGGSIAFISEVKNTKDLLAAMDIFIMPSLQEGLGLALMEAMAQGVAVVGSAVGGIKTLIQDKVNGLLVPPADAPALAQAIITLLKDSGLRRNLGTRAREFIIANFSKEEMVDKTEIVYCQSLKTPRA